MPFVFSDCIMAGGISFQPGPSTVTTSGSNTILQFNSSGSYTA